MLRDGCVCAVPDCMMIHGSVKFCQQNFRLVAAVIKSVCLLNYISYIIRKKCRSFFSTFSSR